MQGKIKFHFASCFHGKKCVFWTIFFFFQNIETIAIYIYIYYQQNSIYPLSAFLRVSIFQSQITSFFPEFFWGNIESMMVPLKFISLGVGNMKPSSFIISIILSNLNHLISLKLIHSTRKALGIQKMVCLRLLPLNLILFNFLFFFSK